MKERPERVLLDTHAVIWLVDGSLPPEATELIVTAGRQGGALLSPISVWEIGLLTRPRGSNPPRLELDPDPERWVEALLAKSIIAVAPLTPRIALAASFLPGELHDDPADRLLVATARALDVPLITRDRRLLDYARAGHVSAIPC